MRNVITFYPNKNYPPFTVHDYEAALWAIARELDLTTTQMCLLNKAKEYDLIRIVNSPEDVIEIRNNHDGTYECDRTERTLRRAHSFFHLWENGEFER